MSAKIFSMEPREDGGARFVLNYKHIGRSGIQRISCDLTQTDLLQMVLFAEALNLRNRLGPSAASDVAIDGWQVSFVPAQRELILERQAGYSQKTARMPVDVFLSEMAGMTDICLARAETSKNGPALKSMLAECRPPAEFERLLGLDLADLAMHQLREIALLILAQDAAIRGSVLARKLRGKKSQDQAREAVISLVLTLAAECMPGST